MKTAGIYIIINNTNNKVYVGSSRNIESRLRVHWSRLRLNKHHSPHLQLSYNLSPKSFSYKIIEIIQDLSILEIREQHWVDSYKSYESESGYNAVRTVSKINPNRMRERWAKEGAKEAQSVRMKEVCASPEHRSKLSVGHLEYFKDPANRFKKVLSNPLRKRVRVIETGQIFESIAHASKELGVSVVKIRDNASGKRKPKKGLSFEWVDSV